MTKIDEALTETIADMIRSFDTCGCCDSDSNIANLIKRALVRTPVDWWPNADVLPKNFPTNSTLYEPIARALIERRITWEHSS